MIEEINFLGPAGRIEGRYHQGKKENAPIALVLHAHPLEGGSMNDRVTYTLFHTFMKKGFSVLRFNFRGVGRSQGKYDEGEGELSDAACALDWIQNRNPDVKGYWIGGFSFGAWIGLQLLMRRPEIRGFVSVSTPAKKHDFSFLAPCPASGLLLHGGQDEHIPEPEAKTLVQNLNEQKHISITYKVFPRACHHFVKHLKPLHEEMDKYVDKILKKFQDD